MDENQARFAVLKVADDAEDDEYLDSEGAVGLDVVECVGAKPHLRNFQESSCGKKHKVVGTVAEAFEFATEFINQAGPVDAGSLTALVSVKKALAIGQVAAENDKEQLPSLHKKHVTLEGHLLMGFIKTQATWKEVKEALCRQSKTARNILDQVRLTEAKTVEEFWAE